MIYLVILGLRVVKFVWSRVRKELSIGMQLGQQVAFLECAPSSVKMVMKNHKQTFAFIIILLILHILVNDMILTTLLI